MRFSKTVRTSLTSTLLAQQRDKLADAIDEQAKAGIHTRYQDRSHHIQFLFYSPEGLSIELTDDAEYDVQLFDHDKLRIDRAGQRALHRRFDAL